MGDGVLEGEGAGEMNSELVWAIIISWLGGLIMGWVWRSLKFGADKQCANPDHEDNEKGQR